ncbi:MAG: nuclear transport factor 2 family protein [Myxococcota bacterium]
MSPADDRFSIIRILDHYEEILDTRDWHSLCEVFTPNAEMDFVAWQAMNLDEVRAQLRAFLDHCGPTQHLLGNYRIEFHNNDRAHSVCYVRAMHFGKGDHKGKRYEMWGEYRDEFVRTASGWRIRKRVARPRMHDVDASLLGPPAKSIRKS